jgi:hypothetical protein
MPQMPDQHEQDFATAVRRAGLTIPPERWEVMRDAVAGLWELIEVLDDPLAYEDEPAVLPDLRAGARR